MKTIILAGGVGTRLWPLSREYYPKQFIPMEGTSLFQRTCERAQKFSKNDEIYVVTNEIHRYLVANQMDELGCTVRGRPYPCRTGTEKHASGYRMGTAADKKGRQECNRRNLPERSPARRRRDRPDQGGRAARPKIPGHVRRQAGLAPHGIRLYPAGQSRCWGICRRGVQGETGREDGRGVREERIPLEQRDLPVVRPGLL